MPRFLDEVGLSLFWNKIKTHVTKYVSEYVSSYVDSKLNTRSIKVSDNIKINGGPLDSAAMREVFPKGLTAGMTTQQVLEKMLCRDVYPSPSVSSPSITSSFAAPSFTITSGTIEVGTDVIIPKFTGYNPTNSTKARIYSGFTYGYSTRVGGEITQGNPPTINVSGVGLNSGEFEIKRDYTLFGKTSSPSTSKKGATSTAISIESETVKVEEGVNSVKFTISGPGFKGVVTPSPEYFVVSNLLNTSTDHKIASQPQATVSNATATSNSTTKSVTGAYKYFLGYSTKISADSFNSSDIRALTTKSGWITKGGETVIIGDSAIKSNGQSIVIACPSKYKLSSITNGLGANIIGNFNSISEKIVQTGTINTTYRVYVYPITNGAAVEFKNVKLNVNQ